MAAGNVIAPMSGTLVTMNAVENSFISTTMPVAVIDGADQMKVTVSVAETLVPKLTIGDSADVSVSAAGADLHRHHPGGGALCQPADQALHRHPGRARGRQRTALRYVCGGDVPHGPLRQHRGGALGVPSSAAARASMFTSWRTTPPRRWK